MNNTAPSLPENRPSDKELALLLISRELQNTRLLHSLRQIGFETASYYLDFRRTIFSLMDFGLSMDEDELCHWYYDLLYEMSERIDPHDEKVLNEQAHWFYGILQEKKERLVETQNIASPQSIIPKP